MPDYRVYVVDHDGEFFTSHALTCANDAEAIQTSQKLIERQGIELWQRDRKIAVFSSPDNAPKEQRP